MIQIFSAGRDGQTNRPKVVQEVLADLKKLFWAIMLSPLRFEPVNYVIRVISLNGDSMSSGLQVLEFPRRSVEGRAEF